MAKKKRRNSMLDVASANADLRYGPEASSIQALLGQAAEDYRTDRRSANAQASTIIRGARRARPLLKRIYNQAASGVKVAQQDVEDAFNQAGVTPDNAFRTISEAEGAAYRQRMTAEAAQARRQTVRDAQDARLGRIFALGAARDRYNQTTSQLQQRATDLMGERQSFLVSELGRMRSERKQQRTQIDVAMAQQGLNPKTGKPYPGSKAAENRFEAASRDDRKQLTTALARAFDTTPDLVGIYSRKEAAELLRSGLPADSKSGDPGFKAISDQLAVRVALDMAYNGSISNGTRAELLRQGFRPSELDGVRYVSNAKRRQKIAANLRRKRAVNQGGAVGTAGASVPVVGGILGLGQ